MERPFFLKFISLMVLIAGFSISFFGCAPMKVSRVAPDKEIALTDRWNDEDSRQVAQQMVKEMFEYPWLKRFKKDFSGKRPTIVIQRIMNKSHEHIAVDTFVNDIKKEVMKSDLADFIVSGDERERVRKELSAQQSYAAETTTMEIGEEQGANFALSGSINSIVDQLEGKRVTSYQIDLKLINLQTTREAWVGQKKIKKYSKRSSFGF